jgi:hypothetical protein
MLNPAPTALTAAAATALALTAAAPLASAETINDNFIGAIGDSYTAEHGNYGNETSNTRRTDARNWVELINQYYPAVTTSFPYGSTDPGYLFNVIRPNPSAGKNTPPSDVRGQGYNFNFAASSYTSQQAINDQLPLANSRVGQADNSGRNTPGNFADQLINTMFVGIGVNDFNDVVNTNYGSDRAAAAAAANSTAATAVSNINTILYGNGSGVEGIFDAAVKADNTRIVLSTIVDQTLWPSRRDRNNLTEVSTAIKTANEAIRQLARDDNRVVVVDQAHLMDDLFDSVVDTTINGERDGSAPQSGDLVIAGQTFVNAPDLMDDDDYDSNPNGFGADVLFADTSHPGTVYHGIFANIVATAMQDGFGIDLDVNGVDPKLMSFDYIFTQANAFDTDGNPLGAADPNFNFDYAAYVLIPEPASVALLAAGLAVCITGRRRAREQQQA